MSITTQSSSLESVAGQAMILEGLLERPPTGEQDVQSVLDAAEAIGAATLHLKGCRDSGGGVYPLRNYKPESRPDSTEPVLGRCAALFVRYSDGLSGLSCSSIFDDGIGPQSTWYLGVPVPGMGSSMSPDRLRFSATPLGSTPIVADMGETGRITYATALRPAARMLLHLLNPPVPSLPK